MGFATPKPYYKDLKSEKTKDDKKQNRGLEIPCDERLCNKNCLNNQLVFYFKK
nr:MAG TPA: hypothetical protein [Caudoviricetes sp.]